MITVLKLPGNYLILKKNLTFPTFPKLVQNHGNNNCVFPKVSAPSTQFPNFFGQNFHTNQNSFHQNNRIQQQRRLFPSRLINIQPRPIPLPKFPSSQQVFGKPKNVWKPNPFILPTPMSTSTRNTVKQQSPHQTHFNQRLKPNIFKQTGPLNFVSKKLFHIESARQNAPNYENAEYFDQEYYDPTSFQNDDYTEYYQDNLDEQVDQTEQDNQNFS